MQVPNVSIMECNGLDKRQVDARVYFTLLPQLLAKDVRTVFAPKSEQSIYPLARSLASPRSVIHADTSTRPRTWVDSQSRIPASAPELWPTTTAEASAPSSSLMNGNQTLSLHGEGLGFGGELHYISTESLSGTDIAHRNDGPNCTLSDGQVLLGDFGTTS